MLDLSMNKISNLDFALELPLLKKLVLADNLIKQIHPFAFSKLSGLKDLDLSMNQLNVLSNVDRLTSLQSLNLRQNMIDHI